MKICYLGLAAALAVSPLAAFAQGTGPNTQAGNTSEAAAAKSGAATNPNQPGATGSTMAPGDKSTIAGDQKATSEQKTGNVSGK